MRRSSGRFGLAALLAVAGLAAVVAFWPQGAPQPAAAQPQPTYTLTLAQPASGGMLDHYPKRGAYAAYERVVIRARQHAGYKLTGWGGDCAHIPASTGWCMLTMDADKTVSGTFGLIGATPTPTPTATPTPTPTPTIIVQPAYTLTLTPPTNGALTANPDQASYAKGATVVVTATPRAGYRLTAWGGGCAGTTASSATCTLTMDADKTVSATFLVLRGPLCTQTTLGVDPASNTGLAVDCAALLGAKNGLRGTATLNWSAGTAMMGWDGVTLGGTPQRVTGLSLTQRGLTGAIPAGLGGLTALRTLNLSGNKLVGAVPAALGSLGELRSLNLSRNRLTGSIPWELWKLRQLESLFLAENRFTGCVPRVLRAVASHDLGRLGLSTCALSLAAPKEGVASVPVPATLQSAIIDDLLAVARARRAALQNSLAAAESSAASAATARARSVARLDAEIARLEAIDRASLVGFNVSVPYVTVRDSRGGDGIAFSKFTYRAEGDASTPVGVTEADPTQFVLWGNATWRNVDSGFKNHTRLPEGLYRWEDEGEGPRFEFILGECDNTPQYVAMKNTAGGSGKWVWAKSTGLQTLNDDCRADDRHHLRFWASDKTMLTGQLQHADDFGHWAVVGAHYEDKTHDIHDDGWDNAERRVLDSLTTPLRPAPDELLTPWTGRLGWIGEVLRYSFGNAISHEDPQDDQGNPRGPQGVAHDGYGYLIEVLDLPDGDPETLAKPSKPDVTVAGNSITVSKPAGALWWDYRYAERKKVGRSPHASTRSIGIEEVLDETLPSVTKRGLEDGKQYGFSVRAYTRRAQSGWSDWSDWPDPTGVPPAEQQCTVVAVGSRGGTAAVVLPGGGTAVSITVDCRTPVMIRATADSGYCFGSWTIASPPDDLEFAAAEEAATTCETTNTHTVRTDSNTPQVTYQAVFEQRRCTLTVTHDAGGMASQSAASVACGGTITATAAANACFDFTGWSGDLTGTSRSVDVRMDRDKSIRAGFAHDGTRHTLTIRVHGGGTATGAGTYDCGTIVTAKATANSGWRFRTWEPSRFGTATTTRVRMTRSGWIAAHFQRDIVAWGSFTVAGTGSSRTTAAGDAARRATAEATRLGADRHWRTSISYESSSVTTTTWRATVSAKWTRSGTRSGVATGILPNSRGEASSVGLQVAEFAAKSAAWRSIPSGATFRGYLSTVQSGYNTDAGLGPIGHWALAYARWSLSGTVSGSGSGATEAVAKSAALADARSNATGLFSNISYSTSRVTNTVVTVTATADYAWVTYRSSQAAAQSEAGVSDESGMAPYEPEPE